jgi:hypothetical protein
MALNSIYQLIHKQRFESQDLLNVYFFNHAAGTGHALELATDFVTDYLPAIQQIQCTQIETISANVINLGDLADFYDLLTPGSVGANGSDMLPVFAAVGYTFKVSTRAVRPGSKRIVGVPESATTNNKITNSGYIAAQEALRIVLENNIVGAADTWEPVILKRVKTLVSGFIPPRYRYTLPTTDSDLVFAHVTAALTSEDITHQVSRKA